MVTIIRMPPLSETMEEGRILKWHKEEGAPVAAGEILCEVETDKVNVVIEAPAEGILRRILVSSGGTAPVGAVVAIIASPDEDVSGFAAQHL
jgi:pyruvate dehydrogenase E2 component (dihydrolipoamide acetyltransferase)